MRIFCKKTPKDIKLKFIVEFLGILLRVTEIKLIFYF